LLTCLEGELTMDTATGVAVAVLIVSLIVVWLLGRAHAFGPLTTAGFLLGVAATASVFILLG
jgi:hypothetical protein